MSALVDEIESARAIKLGVLPRRIVDFELNDANLRERNSRAVSKQNLLYSGQPSAQRKEQNSLHLFSVY